MGCFCYHEKYIEKNIVNFINIVKPLGTGQSKWSSSCQTEVWKWGINGKVNYVKNVLFILISSCTHTSLTMKLLNCYFDSFKLLLEYYISQLVLCCL